MKRWIKHFLRIDPLVGMYVLNCDCVGRVLSRIESHDRPVYLVRYFWCGADGKDKNVFGVCCIDDFFEYMQRGNVPEFFNGRKQAEQRRNWLMQFHEKSGRLRQWQPPTPIKEMPDAG